MKTFLLFACAEHEGYCGFHDLAEDNPFDSLESAQAAFVRWGHCAWGQIWQLGTANLWDAKTEFIEKALISEKPEYIVKWVPSDRLKGIFT